MGLGRSSPGQSIEGAMPKQGMARLIPSTEGGAQTVNPASSSKRQTVGRSKHSSKLRALSNKAAAVSSLVLLLRMLRLGSRP